MAQCETVKPGPISIALVRLAGALLIEQNDEWCVRQPNS